MQYTRRRVIATLGLMAGWPLSRSIGKSATWPSRPIELILPYAAGGPTDVVARALATKMSKELGQPMVVYNRSGASGNIASEFVARSAADGHTVLYHSSGFAISPALYKNPPYDPLRDFSPAAMMATIPAVLMVHPSVPAQNVQDFIIYLQENPGKLSYGTGGVGNITHLAVALFLRANGLEALHVPYKGTAPAMVDFLSGQTQFMLDAVSSALPYVQSQRARAIAVTSMSRSSVLPDVPTLNETVMPGFSAPTWHGMLLPAGTPEPIVQRLNQAANNAARSPDILAQFGSQGVEMQTSTPGQFAQYLRAEVERWREAVSAEGVEAE